MLLSAKRVGSVGKAYGLDMTDEMLAVARANQARAGITNAEFIKGHIEDIPLPDQAVDVIVSNCVINLSGNKDQVLAEAYRVLKPGGRLAVSDIVLLRPLPASVQQNLAVWSGCVAGALAADDYRRKLTFAARWGFTPVSRDDIPGGLLTTSALATACPAISACLQKTLTKWSDECMKKMQIFEPAMCCPTGLCGVSVDPELLRISAVLNSLKKNGITVDRFNLTDAPMEFVNNAVINQFINAHGVEKLPATVVDGEIVITGRYPSNKDFINILQISASLLGEASATEKGQPENEGGCGCAGGTCC